MPITPAQRKRMKIIGQIKGQSVANLRYSEDAFVLGRIRGK